MKHRKKSLRILFNRFLKDALKGLDKMICAPFSTFLSIMVIAFALLLPLSFNALLKNFRTFDRSLNVGVEMTVYLKVRVTEEEAKALFSKLQNRSDIYQIRYISSFEGAEFLQKSLIEDTIFAHLKENPLPQVLIIQPASEVDSMLKMENLLSEIDNLSEVEKVEIDRDWIKNVYFLTHIIDRTLFILLIVFTIMASLTVISTVKLAVKDFSRGALYIGVYYGFFGALLAWLMVTIMLLWLRKPIEKIVAVFVDNFSFQGLTFHEITLLFVVAIILSFISAQTRSLFRKRVYKFPNFQKKL